MKVSINWLKKYIQTQNSAIDIARLLTNSGLEVASISNFKPITTDLSKLVIGEVVTCLKHTNADKLKVTTVNVGTSDLLQIVCGAKNIDVGQKVIIAPVGSVLYSTAGKSLEIKKTTIRGTISEGMICATDEIGIEEECDGIMVLNTSLPPGTSAAEYFKVENDQILEVEITPNRGDACSHIGVARDLAAIMDKKVNYPSIDEFKTEKTIFSINVSVLDTVACPRYSGVIISNVTVSESPKWLKHCLKSIGVKPVNNIVDITNFVMHEIGQPMHAYDYDKIAGDSITVKNLSAGTVFTTLDGIERNLSGNELLICDVDGAIGLAGILGGKRTSISAETKNVFLESAYFDYSSIRKSAKHHKINTDASFRFERGTDPNITVYAIKRACLLIQELSHGCVASDVIDIYPNKIDAYKVEVFYKNVHKLIGMQIPHYTIKQILRALEISIIDEKEESFIAVVPTYRKDVQREADIVEEIIRIYGYVNLTTNEQLSSSYLEPHKQNNSIELQKKISDLLAYSGYSEICSNPMTKSTYFSLCSAELQDKEMVRILNPLSDTTNAMRQTLLFSGLETLAYNINRKQADLKLFEFGRIYNCFNNDYIESKKLGIWLTGNYEEANWSTKSRNVSFVDCSAIVHKILGKCGITNFKSSSSKSEFYEEALSTYLNDDMLLTSGLVCKKIIDYFSIKQPVFFVDVNWEMLLCKIPSANLYKPISKFPEVKRDLSILLSNEVTYEKIKTIIGDLGENMLRNMTVFDVYTGDNLENGKKAYSISFTLQSDDGTLDDKCIAATMLSIENVLKKNLGATIRE